MALVDEKQLRIDRPNLDIKRERVLYVDPVNGDNLDAIFAKDTNNFRTPFKDVSAARGHCDPPFTLIVMLPGVYNGVYELIDGVDVYAMPGVLINGGFEVSDPNATSSVYGYAEFGSFSSPALHIKSTAVGSNIRFEFDKIDTNYSYGIWHQASGPGTSLKAVGNSISAGVGVRIATGEKDIHVYCRDYIEGYGEAACTFGKSSAIDTKGSWLIESSTIRTTNTAGGGRTVLYFAEGLKGAGGNDYKIEVRSNKIVQSDADANSGSITSCVWIDGGDNIHVHGDLIGKKTHCVASRGGGASYHTGTFYFYGNMYSEKACISSSVKAANGNGWHNIVINGSRLETTGTGAGYRGSVIETYNWNSIHGGIPGTIFINDSVIYNKDIDSDVVKLDQPGVSGELILNNSILYSEGTLGESVSTTQANKVVDSHGSISNKQLGTNITTNLASSQLVYEPNYKIPKNVQ